MNGKKLAFSEVSADVKQGQRREVRDEREGQELKTRQKGQGKQKETSRKTVVEDKKNGVDGVCHFN